MSISLFKRRFWLGLLLALGAAGAVVYPIIHRVIADKITQHKLAYVRAEYNRLLPAMASLGLDNCGLYYPDDTHMRRVADPTLPLTFERQPAFHRQGRLLSGVRCLTTPVSYLPSLPEDPFNPGHDYGYAAIRGGKVRGDINSMAILSSPGPDGVEDLPLPRLRAGLVDYFNQGPKNHLLNPEARGRLWQTIVPYLYDPSNGTRSGGDLILVTETHNREYGFGCDNQALLAKGDIAPPTTPRPSFLKAENLPTSVPTGGEPPLTEEDQLHVVRISLPADLLGVLLNADILQAGGRELNVEHVNRLGNHLGAFREFFAHPRPMPETGFTAALKTWQQEDPKWWQATAKPCTGSPSFRRGFSNLTAYDLFPILILYGKTQLLLAGDEAARKETDAALDRIDALRFIFLSLRRLDDGMDLIKWDASIARIHEEMNRLCDELEKSIQEKTRVKPETK